jgi:hypothetical protein
MDSLVIQFNESGAVLDLERGVTGFDAVVQDALVNIGTRIGTDNIDPERGTSLEENALQAGVVISDAAATHVSNIATAETLFYITESEDTVEDDSLVDLQLQPVELTLEKLNINAVMVSEQGNRRGVPAVLAT